MPLPPIEWEGLEPAEKLALAAAGEASPLSFTSLWFNITQGESFKANWHHHYYSWALKRVLAGKVRCLVINVPPGSTKTEFFSIHGPAYCAVKFPKVRILNGSYSKDLVVENSERTRALIKSDEFQEMYPRDMGKDKADNWSLLNRGKASFQMFSRSNGGQITGARGGYMTDGFSGYVAADDWDKPDDMFSDAKRGKSHTRLVNTLRSRRAVSTDENATPLLFIQQRLHVNDSSAFILSGGMGVTVDLHLEIPALIDREYIDKLPEGIKERCISDICGTPQTDGKWSYWPAKEGIGNLLALRDAHPYTFLSQYMQAPDTLEGGVFQAGDFVYFGDVEQGADIPEPDTYKYRFITADTAQKTNEWNDWTVLAEWGVTDTHIHRLSMKREKMAANVLRREFETFVKAAYGRNGNRWGTLRTAYVEDKSSGTGLIQEVLGRLPVEITPVQRNNDKLTRAMDVQPHHIAKRVALPYVDGDNFEFVSEVAAFTHDDTHKHDDQTDVMIDALYFTYVKPASGEFFGVL